jgi:hypothetical protein
MAGYPFPVRTASVAGCHHYWSANPTRQILPVLMADAGSSAFGRYRQNEQNRPEQRRQCSSRPAPNKCHPLTSGRWANDGVLGAREIAVSSQLVQT